MRTVHPLSNTLRRAEAAVELQQRQPYALGPALFALRCLADASRDERGLDFSRGVAARLGAEDAGKALFDMAARAPVRHFTAGEPILSEGERSYGIYVVMNGCVRLEREGEPVAALDAGQSFGEISALSKAPRGLSAVAQGGASVMVLERKSLAISASRVPGLAGALRRLYRDRILGQLIPPDCCLSALDVDERHKLAQAFRAKRYEPGELVLQQGLQGPGFFVVVAGRAEVYRVDENDKRDDLATIGVGDIFGEISLLEDMPISATVRATEPLICFVLSRGVFRQTLANMPEQMERVLMMARQRMARQLLGPRMTGAAGAEVETLANQVIVGSMTCPTCGFDQPFALHCTSCGGHVLRGRDRALPEVAAEPSLESTRPPPRVPPPLPPR